MSAEQFLKCYRQLSKTLLLSHVNEQEFLRICEERELAIKHCQSGEKILGPDSHKDTVIVVVSGRIQAFHEDLSGKRFIIKSVESGEALSITAPSVHNDDLSYSVEAEEKNTTVLLLALRKLTRPWPTKEPEISFLRDLMHFMLSAHHLTYQHLIDLSKRTTREKLMSFLLSTALQNQSNNFTISMSRQELADYLCVDRSAMSTELGKLQKDGFMDFEGNHFVLHSNLMKHL